MSFTALDDFRFHSEVPVDLIDKYENQIPPELLGIWQNHGFGSFGNGYIKIINPDEYTEVLASSYFASDVAIPIFATGFADIITWEEDRFLGLVQYRKADVTMYPLNFVHFLARFYSSQCVADFLDNAQYNVAVKMLGKLNYDECFGYVPLLALGGSEKVERLQKMKIIPHIDLITDMVGRIE